MHLIKFGFVAKNRHTDTTAVIHAAGELKKKSREMSHFHYGLPTKYDRNVIFKF